MLQDPEVLYRVETGAATGDAGIFKLDSYEVASRLSFLLWGSGPDDALLDQAKSGALVDTASREAAAMRLLADTHAKAQIERFHSMWLGYRAIPASADLAAAFSLETNKLIDKVVFDQPSSYLDLFTSPQTYVNATTAAQYGLTAPASGEGWVPYADDRQRRHSFARQRAGRLPADSATPARPSAASSCRRGYSVTKSRRHPPT